MGMEKQIERRLVQKIKEKNGLCLKLTGYKGIPDRIVLIDGRCYFVELKDEGKKLRHEQKVWQDKLQALGFVSVMLDSKDAVDEFVRDLKAGEKDGR